MCIGGEKDRSGIVDRDSIEHSAHRGLRKGGDSKGGHRRQGRQGRARREVRSSVEGVHREPLSAAAVNVKE